MRLRQMQAKKNLAMKLLIMQAYFLVEEKQLVRHLKRLLFHCLQNLSKKQAEKKKKKRKDDLKEFSAKINKIETEKGISTTVFKRFFDYEIPSQMLSDLFNSNKKENTDLVTSIRNRAEDLINEIFKAGQNEATKYKLNETIAAVEEIYNFNEKHQNQTGGGSKILTPQRIFCRISIS